MNALNQFFYSVLSQRMMYLFVSILLLKDVWPVIFQSFHLLSKIHTYVKILEVTRDFQNVSNFLFLNNHGLNMVVLSKNCRGYSESLARNSLPCLESGKPNKKIANPRYAFDKKLHTTNGSSLF